MKRRPLLGLALPALAGAAVVGPAHAAEAPAQRWRIGYLSAGQGSAPGTQGRFEQIQSALRDRGLGPEAVQFDVRFAANDATRLPELARELLALRPHLLMANLTPAAHAVHQLTRELPIVLAGVADPVGTGLVQSLSRPGGNVTGISALGPELAAKVLELLREVRPRLARVGALVSESDPFTPTLVRGLEMGAAALSLQLEVVRTREAASYSATFETWQRQRVEAVFVQPTLPFARAIELALAHRLPSASFVRGWPEGGGLLAYTANTDELARQVATMVDAILRGGAKPADMPVRQVSTLDLLINRQTARRIGVALPHALLVRATEIIE